MVINEMKICQILAINLQYYRKKYNLSQEKFASLLGTSLPYLSQIENNKVDVKSSTIDKFADRINKYDKNINISSEDLVTYDKNKLTNYSRIDSKK